MGARGAQGRFTARLEGSVTPEMLKALKTDAKRFKVPLSVIMRARLQLGMTAELTKEFFCNNQ